MLPVRQKRQQFDSQIQCIAQTSGSRHIAIRYDALSRIFRTLQFPFKARITRGLSPFQDSQSPENTWTGADSSHNPR